MATQFVMPEITEDLDHFVRNFDPVRDKAMKEQAKAQRAAERERAKRARQEKQIAKQQEAFEQDRLRQQMAFQQSQLDLAQSIPSAADTEIEGNGHTPKLFIVRQAITLRSQANNYITQYVCHCMSRRARGKTIS